MERDQPEDTRPWTESQWERFLQRSNVRSAKYGELLETLWDDPDREKIIAREMGWKEHVGFEVDDAADDPEIIEALRASDEALKEIAAYSKGLEWMEAVARTLDHLADEVPAREPDDPTSEARANSLVVALRIAGGHAMGYDDDVLCGNIVCCRQALEAVRRSLSALKLVLAEGRIAPAALQRLIEDGTTLEQLVEDRVAELRQLVWWE